jgi:hypothetical protein
MIVINATIQPFVAQTLWFDDGPPVHDKKIVASMINTSSIDTSQIATYKQGVELRHQSDWDAGVCKIHAGEPGHVIPKRTFGQGITYRENIAEFEDVAPFDPTQYIALQSSDVYDPANLSPTKFAAWPVVLPDNDGAPDDFDGVIEPLSIRNVASFSSIDSPFEAHAVYGEVCGGTANIRKATPQILSLDYFNPHPTPISFIDTADNLGNTVIVGYVNDDQTSLLPFTDQRLPRGVPLSQTNDSQMNVALNLQDIDNATGHVAYSTDSYVRYNQVSAPCGFVYDSVQGVGTDSIAFGGLTY